MRAATTLLIMTSVLFAGCVGSESTAPPPSSVAPSASAAEFSEDTGAIEGLVLTDESLPAEEATVGIIETGELTITALDGRFSFSNLAPGKYSVSVAALGYEATAKVVTVEPGVVTNANFVLVPVPIDEPYHETVMKVGTLSCSITMLPGWPLWIPDPSQPTNTSRGLLAPNWYTGLQACGVIDDRFIQQFNVSAGVEELLLEVRWDSTQVLGSGLSIAWEHPNGVNDGSPVFESPSGQSPLRAFANHTKVLEVANHQEIDPLEDDWQTQTRVFSAANTTEFYAPITFPPIPPWGQPSNKFDVGFAFEQRTEQFQTNFYGMVMPADFSAMADA